MWVEYFPPNGEGPITFAYEPPYIAQEFGGMSDTRSAPSTVRGPGQRGSTLRDVLVTERDITMTVMVMIEPSDIVAFEAAKRALSRALIAEPGEFGRRPPLGLLRFHRDDPSLEVYEVEALPRESPQYTASGVSWAKADIEFVAPYPFYRETTDRAFSVAASGGFQFPMEFDPEIEFPSYNITVDVDNGGDVIAPIRVRINGDVTDPVIANETTGESLTYIGTIPAGSYLEIGTEYGDKYAILADSLGAVSNAMGSLDHSTSKFWALRPGVNTVSFSAAINVSGSALVYWRQRVGSL
jgi:hypothetical protein